MIGGGCGPGMMAPPRLPWMVVSFANELSVTGGRLPPRCTSNDERPYPTQVVPSRIRVGSAVGGRMKSKLVGAGLVAGATWVAYNWLRRPEPLKSNYLDAPTKVLIVGGGFGGLA